jgi:hypothetical protein
MKNQVTKSQFLSWYFSNQCDAISIGYEIISALNEDGKYAINVNELFDCCGYIPREICEDNDGDNEYQPSELELING